MTNDGFMRF
jgi:hypothetical protein